MAVGSARGGRQSCYFLIWTREWKAVEQFEVGLCPPLPPVNGMVWHFVRVGGRPAAGWKVGTWAGVSETRCGEDVQKWGKQSRKSPLKCSEQNGPSSWKEGKAGSRRGLWWGLTCASPSSYSAFLPQSKDVPGSDINSTPLPAGVSQSVLVFLTASQWRVADSSHRNSFLWPLMAWL